MKNGCYAAALRFVTEAWDCSLCSNSSEIMTYWICGRGGVVSSNILFYPKSEIADAFGNLLGPSLDLVARYDDIKSDVWTGGLFYSENTDPSLLILVSRVIEFYCWLTLSTPPFIPV